MSVRAALDTISLQQDYAWFLAGLAWTVALIFGRWLRPASPSGWVRWSAISVILSSVVSLECLVRAVQAVPDMPVHLSEDIFLAAAQALQAAGWVWVATGGGLRRRLTTAALLGIAAAGIVGLHVRDPRDGGCLLALATAAAGLALVRRGKFRPPEDLAILLVVLAACVSPIGPAAFYMDSMQRWTEMSPVGPFAAALLALSGVLIIAGIARKMTETDRPGARISISEDVAPLVAALVAWLTLGLVFSGVMARLARLEFEHSAVGRVSAAASLLNSSPEAAIVDEALGPAFKPTLRPGLYHEPGGSELPYTHAASLMDPRVKLVLAQLKRIANADPDVRFVQLETIRDGKELTVLAHFLTPDYIGVVAPIRAVTPAAARSWIDRKAYFEGPVTLAYGEATVARAPLLGSGDRMLGWLSFVLGVGQWESVQADARLLAFSVVGLGVALGLALFSQRIRSRERQAALQAAAAADEANQLKTQFLASVSHELRTPLQTIMGYTELLGGSVTDETARARIFMLQRQGEHMARLVNDLIDLAALEIGAFRFVEAPMSLSVAVLETVEGLRPRSQAKDIGLGLSIGPDLPPWVEGDSVRVGQMVMNLVGNAIKFTTEGKVDVFLDSSSDGGEAAFELRVRDTGPGIPAEEFDQLFKPFSRLTTARNHEGTGLGLALSAALCRSLGGDLTATSDGRTGSEFVARFHLKRCAPPEGKAGMVGLGGARILVADDNRMMRELFTAYLSEIGATCETASDGREALEKAMHGSYQAMVLDLSMPEIDGHHVAKGLRDAGRKLRIVGVSAHAGSEDRALAAQSGMDDFLTKPVELAALARALQFSPPAAAAPDPWRKLRSKWEGDFRTVIPAQAEALQRAIANRDWDHLRKLAHHLKNSAIVLRDDGLFSAFEVLEDGAAVGDVDQVRRGWTRCASALEAWLPDAPNPFPGDFRPDQEEKPTKLGHT